MKVMQFDNVGMVHSSKKKPLSQSDLMMGTHLFYCDGFVSDGIFCFANWAEVPCAYFLEELVTIE